MTMFKLLSSRPRWVLLSIFLLLYSFRVELKRARLLPISLDIELGAQAQVTGLPACGVTCATEAARALGCATDGLNLTCACPTPSFLPSSQSCMLFSCTPADEQAGVQALMAACEAGTSSSASPSPPLSSSSTISMTSFPSAPPPISIPPPSSNPSTSTSSSSSISSVSIASIPPHTSAPSPPSSIHSLPATLSSLTSGSSAGSNSTSLTTDTTSSTTSVTVVVQTTTIVRNSSSSSVSPGSTSSTATRNVAPPSPSDSGVNGGTTNSGSRSALRSTFWRLAFVATAISSLSMI